MKKLLCILLVLTFYKVNGQQSDVKISLSFDEVTLSSALKEIESKTNIRFYFVEDWLNETKVKGGYNAISLTDLLDDILKNSAFNYFFKSNSQVIITRNNRIYDQLPNGFFGVDNTTVTNQIDVTPRVENYNPVFYNEDKKSVPQKIETVRIGKELEKGDNHQFKLSGFVRNKQTREPISNLAIIIKNTRKGVVTDKNGYYELKLMSGLNILETSSLGTLSSTKKVIIYNDGNLDLELEESYETLEEVILETEVYKAVEETNTGVAKVVVEEVKNIPLVLGERDVLQVATTLPGISKTGEGSSGYNVRGGKVDQNLILLDNGVIYNPTHFFGIFSAINPFTTGEFAIYKGNIPAEYGGRLSSVFDLSTKNSNYTKLEGEVSLGPVTSNITLEIPIEKEKAGLLVGARGTYSDWILRSLDDESLKNSEANFYDAIVKYNHRLSKNDDIDFTAYYSKDRFSITSDSLYGYSNRMISVNWNHRFNSKSKGHLVVSNSEYKFDIEYDGNSNRNFNLGFRISETNLKLLLDTNFNNHIKLKYGVSTKLYDVNPGRIEPNDVNSIINPLDIQNERGLESAAYFSGDIDVNEKLNLNIGLRYSMFNSLGASSQNVYEDGLPKSESTLINNLEFDKNEIVKTYSAPELRVSARYYFNANASVKASYNNGYQYIHTLTSNTTVSPTDTWKLSDLNIEPQRSTQYAFGLYSNIMEDQIELSIEGYYKRLYNILDYKVGAQLFLNESLETEVIQGNGRSFGIEFLLKKTKGRLNGWLSYTYSKSEIQLNSNFPEERINNGAYFPANFDKPHDVSVVANYKLTKRFSLSANLAYQTGRPITYPIGKYVYNNAEYVLYSDRNKFRIPDYFRLDLGVNIEGNHKIKKFAHSFWNFSIYNVLGRNNPYSVFFVTDNGDIKAYKSSVFSIPIPTFTYNFKF